MAKFRRVVVAGTFNCIHEGHKKLLEVALNTGEELLVGLTSDEFAKRLKGEAKPYAKRKEELQGVLGKEAGRCEIVEINDEVGVAGEMKELEAIVVSEETETNAWRVNEVRKAKSLPELKIIIIPLVKNREGRKLSCRHKKHV